MDLDTSLDDDHLPLAKPAFTGWFRCAVRQGWCMGHSNLHAACERLQSSSEGAHSCCPSCRKPLVIDAEVRLGCCFRCVGADSF